MEKVQIYPITSPKPLHNIYVASGPGSFANREIVTNKISLNTGQLKGKTLLKHDSYSYIYAYTSKIKINVITYNKNKSKSGQDITYIRRNSLDINHLAFVLQL